MRGTPRTTSFRPTHPKGVCVCLCGPLYHARVKQEVAQFDWAGPVCGLVCVRVWTV